MVFVLEELEDVHAVERAFEEVVLMGRIGMVAQHILCSFCVLFICTNEVGFESRVAWASAQTLAFRSRIHDACIESGFKCVVAAIGGGVQIDAKL